MRKSLFRRMFPNEVHHLAGLHDAIRDGLPLHGRMLDLGCGANEILDRYRGPGWEVWGTDFETHPHLNAPEWFRPLEPNGTIPFPDNYFDVVACTSVLEHVTNPEAFFREVERVLRPGGRFLGHSINGSHYVTWIRRGFGIFPHSVSQRLVKRLYGREENDTFPAFYRLNRPTALANACRGAGLIYVGIKRYADANYFSFWVPLMKTAIVLDRALEGIAPGLGRLYFTAIVKKPA